MILFPNCKINLGLHVTRKREDSYHDIESIFYPVPLNDILEIVPSNSFEHHFYGLPIPGEAAKNLCVKAYDLLKKDFPDLPSIKFFLYKNIPAGAGLGGGSSDGSCMLQLLNEEFRLGLSTPQLIGYALQLGSDCPFFIINKPCFASGRGEILEPVKISLSPYSFFFIHPDIHIDTAWAFSQLTPSIPGKPLTEIIKQPMTTWKDELKNDFEKPVMEKFAELKPIKQKLYDAGAVYASMSGSGSTFFGICEKNVAINVDMD
ncbi:MAG: 4-(cytidine 5'-diphospho)-2-C-methyl-D-erythritol kinase, partial [Bacteroidetes bacterium]|nr:4-(cytidine 5'-diphospho)-2-C-methyl-D-erythritol kinase [Bacteroidota bacterium]